MFHYLAGQQGGQITYLLDEVDGLLQNLGSDLSLFEVMRRASAKNGDARFILAGFRHLRRAVRYHRCAAVSFWRGPDVEAAPIARKCARWSSSRWRSCASNWKIATRSRSASIGKRPASPTWCNSTARPCWSSWETARQRILTQDSLQTVYANDDFRDFLLQTFLSNTQPLERAIVFAMVARPNSAETEFSLKDIDTALDRRNLHVNFTPVE